MSASKKRESLRKVSAIVVALGILTSVSACSGSPFALGACSPVFTDGSNAKLVTAHGDFTADPKAEFPTPIVANDAQARVTVAGKGAVVQPGDAAALQVSVYDARTGERLLNTDYEQKPIAFFTGDDAEPRFARLAQCVPVGSRVVGVGSVDDLLGESMVRSQQIALDLDETVVVIVDVKRSYLGKANGADQLAEPGLPAVALAPNGQPGLTFPSTAGPSETRTAVLKQGSGKTVSKNDRVLINYSTFSWETRMVDKSSWDSGRPALFTAASMTENPNGLPPAMVKAMIGQQVGSQIMVVLPSSQQLSASGSTTVIVFDILGIE